MSNILYTVIAVFLQIISIYSIQFTDADGVARSLSAYEGKKILIVNIATGSGRVGQLAELQQLQTQHQNGLVVLAFPSNSFGNEARSDTAIKSFCQANYGTSFMIAQKTEVTGSGAHALYQWLSDQGQNGEVSLAVGGDFQKYLIGTDGKVKGVFGGSVSPLSQQIQTAITAQ